MRQLDSQEYFLVYALNSPTYSRRFFGGIEFRHDRIIKGEIAGSALVVGGGLFNTESQLIEPSGCCRWATLAQYCEKVVAELAKPLDSIYIVLDNQGESAERKGLTTIAKSVGFDVAISSCAVVLRGSGSRLGLLPWYRTAWPAEPNLVYSYTRIERSFEKDLEDAALSGVDITVLMNQHIANASAEPNELALFVTPGGLDGSDIIINSSLTDADLFRNILRRSLTDSNVVLFYAGSIEDLEDDEYFRGDIKIPIPADWKLIL